MAELMAEMLVAEWVVWLVLVKVQVTVAELVESLVQLSDISWAA
jgi:hypothetical protein